jgi:hypothetical protein
VRSSAHGWSAPTLVNAANVDAAGIEVAITDGGEIFASWRWARDLQLAPVGVAAAAGSVSSGWREPVTLAPPPTKQFGIFPHLATAAGPHAIIGWSGPAATVSVTR